MTNSQSSEPGRSDLDAAAVKNGEIIKAWFRSNDWPQSITDEWATQGGSSIGPWASQICGLLKGTLNPRAPLFVALAEFNEAVARQEFPGVTRRKTLDRLKAGTPLCHEDGRLFTAADFFSLFIGAIEPPAQFRRSQITDKQAAALAEQCVGLFREAAVYRMTSLPEVWNDLKPLLKGWSTDQVDQFQEVLCGLHVWTGAEASELQRGKPSFPAVDVLMQLGGEATV